jgi:hypothetical protein
MGQTDDISRNNRQFGTHPSSLCRLCACTTTTAATSAWTTGDRRRFRGTGCLNGNQYRSDRCQRWTCGRFARFSNHRFFPSGVVNSPGTIHLNDAAAQQAHTDAQTAYNNLAAATVTQDLTGQDLGNVSTLANPLMPGVYHFNTSAQLTGTLYLDAQSNPNSVFIFQIGSTLTTASGSSVIVINAPANW